MSGAKGAKYLQGIGCWGRGGPAAVPEIVGVCGIVGVHIHGVFLLWCFIGLHSKTSKRMGIFGEDGFEHVHAPVEVDADGAFGESGALCDFGSGHAFDEAHD